MDDMTLLEAIAAYENHNPEVSRQQILKYIRSEIEAKYAHLQPRFFPDNCLQAKITANTPNKVVMLQTPQPFIDILSQQGFVAHRFEHIHPHCDASRDGQQFILINREIRKIGYQFVLKATLGPNFISVWFRNESRDWRLDLPLFYALEILNKLQGQVNAVLALQQTADKKGNVLQQLA